MFSICADPIKGLGMLATKKILPGTVIITETPLLVVEGVQKDPTLLYGTTQMNRITHPFGKLSDSDKDRFMALSPGRWEHGGISKPPSDAYLKAIVATNGIGCGPGKIAVYDKISRINHSCRPNARWFFHDILGQQVVVADHTIETGQAICTEYFEGGKMTAKQRQEQLKDRRINLCFCEVCVGAESDIRRSDALRVEYVTLERGLNQMGGSLSFEQAKTSIKRMIEIAKLEFKGSAGCSKQLYNGLRQLSMATGDPNGQARYMVDEFRQLARCEGFGHIPVRPRIRAHIDESLREFEGLPEYVRTRYKADLHAVIRLKNCTHCGKLKIA
eukprot:506710_1